MFDRAVAPSSCYSHRCREALRSEGSRGHGGHRHWDMGVAERVGRAVRDLDDTKGVVSSSLVRGGTVAGT